MPPFVTGICDAVISTSVHGTNKKVEFEAKLECLRLVLC